jgi:hypothetical protein
VKYEQLLQEIKNLKVGSRKEIYSELGNQIIIFRPEKLGRSLKNKDYDISKNFQIILKKPDEKEFLPNHLRVLIEFNHKMKNPKEKFNVFYNMVEEIYSGEDPLKFKERLKELNLSEELDPSIITLCLIQLFMAEQDINYTEGKVQPPRAFLMGYIRFIKTKEQNIDKILWSSIRHPPRLEFWKNFHL